MFLLNELYTHAASNKIIAVLQQSFRWIKTLGLGINSESMLHNHYSRRRQQYLTIPADFVVFLSYHGNIFILLFYFAIQYWRTCFGFDDSFTFSIYLSNSVYLFHSLVICLYVGNFSLYLFRYWYPNYLSIYLSISWIFTHLLTNLTYVSMCGYIDSSNVWKCIVR